jgi:hypothetical protein
MEHRHHRDRHVVMQDEYADALIDMCALGCMDMRGVRIIYRILREISSCPAMVKTKSLEARLERVNNHIRGCYCRARLAR